MVYELRDMDRLDAPVLPDYVVSRTSEKESQHFFFNNDLLKDNRSKRGARKRCCTWYMIFQKIHGFIQDPYDLYMEYKKGPCAERNGQL